MTFEIWLQNRYRLSPSQARVANLILHGYDNQALADHLHRTMQTVKFHITAVYKRMGAKPRARLIELLTREHQLWLADVQIRPLRVDVAPAQEHSILSVPKEDG
jgi:DNA-binding CsgD family transcriptional regulator